MVTFLEAIALCQWVRRSSWPAIDGWVHVSRTGPAFGPGWQLSWEDLLASDWLAYLSDGDDPVEDDALKRFQMMELD